MLMNELLAAASWPAVAVSGSRPAAEKSVFGIASMPLALTVPFRNTPSLARNQTCRPGALTVPSVSTRIWPLSRRLTTMPLEPA